MKQNRRDWLGRILAVLLLAGACGVIIWQGMQYLSDQQAGHSPERIQLLTTNETTTMPEIMTTVSLTTLKKEQTTNGVTAAHAETETAVGVVFPLELNQASAAELQQLPGIGAALSDRIVTYRTQIGGFLYREQLLEVNGIGEAKLSQIYDLIYLTNEQHPQAETVDVPEEQNVPAPAEEVSVDTPEAVINEPEQPTSEPIMIELNQATKEQLLQIPDMTPELADAILTLRTQIQQFSSVYELLYVEGMTTEKFEKISDFVQITEVYTP